MNRADKHTLVETMQGLFANAPNAVLAHYTGLTANQSNDLRRRIGRAGGHCTVLKNRLAKRAAAGTALEGMVGHFAGPCALLTHPSDPVVLAKTVTEFVKDNPRLEILAALVEGKDVVDPAAVKQLSSLPGLPELRAQLLALIQTPATMLVRLVGTPGTQVARVLDARRGSLEGSLEGQG